MKLYEIPEGEMFKYNGNLYVSLWTEAVEALDAADNIVEEWFVVARKIGGDGPLDLYSMPIDLEIEKVKRGAEYD